MARYTVLGLLMFSAVAAQAATPATEWLPQGAVMVWQVSNPGAVLDWAVDLGIPKMVSATSTYQKTVETKDFQGLKQVFATLAAQSGTDWKGLIRKLTGGGIVYASYPGDVSVITADAEDPAALQRLTQAAKMLIGLSGGKSGVFFKEYPGGVSVWTLDGKQFFASTAARLITTNRGEMLKNLFERQPGAPSLATWPAYTQAGKAAGVGAAATFFLNMAMLNQVPSIQKSLETPGSPIEVLLNGALKQSLRASNWASVGLRAEGNTVLVHAAVDGKADVPFAIPPRDSAGILPNLEVPRELASLSLWRDLGKFYAAKDTIYPEKTSGGILFENFLEIFFTGRDLSAEVFSRFNPAVRLVVARQEFDKALGTPQEQYPAAALVFRVEHPEEFGEVVEEAWQKAVGLTNFTRGQQAQPGLLMDKATYAGVPITYCYFSVRNEKDRAHLPSRFNMRPALARVGPYIILSTTDALTKDLIDAVNKEDARVPATRSNAHTAIEITGGADIAALIDINRSELVRQSVTGSGAKPEAAEAQLELYARLLKYFDRARLTMSATPDGQQAELELRLK